MFIFYLLSIFLSIRQIDSLLCMNILNNPILLVDKSEIEIGCQGNQGEIVSGVFFQNSENNSKACTFTFADSLKSANKNPDCFFGERISFIGNVFEKRFRFQIKPLAIQGKKFYSNFLGNFRSAVLSLLLSILSLIILFFN
jgi:hypothetical protein